MSVSAMSTWARIVNNHLLQAARDVWLPVMNIDVAQYMNGMRVNELYKPKQDAHIAKSLEFSGKSIGRKFTYVKNAARNIISN